MASIEAQIADKLDDEGDIILVVGPHGRHIHLHSRTLITNSQVFKSMLAGTFKEAIYLGRRQTTSPYKLELPDDNYNDLLCLCKVLCHKAPLISEWLRETINLERDVLSMVENELSDLRGLAVLVDKYQCLPPRIHLASNWLTAIMRWTDLANERPEYHDIHLRLRVVIVEVAYVLQDEPIFKRATQLLLTNSFSIHGLEGWSDQAFIAASHLPESFLDHISAANAENWKNLHTEVARLRDFLSLGTAQPIVNDIRQTTTHGFWFHGQNRKRSIPFDDKSFEDITQWSQIQALYRNGLHDALLLAGLSIAINRVLMKEVEVCEAVCIDRIVKELQLIRVQPFASMRSIEPISHENGCRACEFDVSKALKDLLSKISPQIEGLSIQNMKTRSNEYSLP